MTFPTVTGVHLLPSTGEFAYDTISAVGFQRGSTGLNNATILNFFSSSPGGPTDYTNAITQFQAEHPECTTVSLVIAWFFNSEDASSCNVYPSTNFILGEFEQWVGGAFAPSNWKVSGLTEQDYPGLIPLPALPGSTNFVYGGTPSDPSVVRCIRDLKSRGFKVVFYPFLLGTSAGFPWRGRITSPGDLTQTATNDVATFMGNAAVGDFIRDQTNLTVGYSGFLFDWTFRRMILHYANLCVIAGGVNLFVIGSELRGLETLRGPAWTKTGAVDGSGNAVWDYPMVAQLNRLANDVRTTFDGAGLTKNSDQSGKPDHLFGRLVELDGLAALGRKRAVAASRSVVGQPEHRFRQLRQLHAFVRLDELATGVWTQRTGASRNSLGRGRLNRRTSTGLVSAGRQRSTRSLISKGTLRAVSISIISTMTAIILAAVSIRTERICKCRCRKATV